MADAKTSHSIHGKTPEGALRLWFVAAFQYGSSRAADQAQGREGLSYLTIPFKEAADWEKRPSYQTFRERMLKAQHIFRSFCKGSSPENGYAADTKRFDLDIARQDPPGDHGVAIHLRSSGADRPRPVYLKRSEPSGLWYVDSFDDVYLDVKPARQPGM